MKNLIRALAGTILLSTLAMADEAVIGYAYSEKEKSRLAYTELHEISHGPDGRIQRAKTTYKNPGGEVIAELTCDYSKKQFTPDFEFIDHRSGYWEKSVVNDLGITVQIKEDKNSPVKSSQFKPTDNWSASQGLNQFIVNHLRQTLAGRDLVTTFVLPAHLTTVTMLVTGSSPDGQKAQLEIKVKNPFLRLFAPKIELVYEIESNRLLTYSGNSNIYTDSGDKQTVFIEYNYPVKTASIEPASGRSGQRGQ